jgi:endonuclease/exonuclease/phosphatase family metal-dependent hydrolase
MAWKQKIGRNRRVLYGLPAGLLLTALLAFGDMGAMAGMNTKLQAIKGRVTARTENHTGADGPLYMGGHAGEPPAGGGEILIVSYNLHFGEAVAEAVAAFRDTAALQAADIILLQEMDEAGVDTFARTLGYNYVYYPASVGPNGHNFGNAILSLWPIEDPAKLILPGVHPLSGQQRTATRATVRLGGEAVRVYSTHLEIATAPPSMRVRQSAAILKDIPADTAYVIVGGDFNTVTPRGVTLLGKQFSAGQMHHDSAGLGPTLRRFGVRPSAADHLFSRGFSRLDAGVLHEVGASDHFPVWVRLGS